MDGGWWSWVSFLIGMFAGSCVTALTVGFFAVAGRGDIPEQKVPEKKPQKVRRVN